MTASLLPNGKQQFIDANGNPLAGGSVYFYIPNTTAPKDTWQDSEQTILNTNPVVLDASGEALIYGDGIYRQIVKDAAANLIWDQLTKTPQIADIDGLEDRLGGIESAVNFATLAAVEADNPDADPDYYITAFYDANQVAGSGAKYKKVTSEPSHPGKVQNGNGTWYEWANPNVYVRAVGAKGDGIADDTAALNKASAIAHALGIPVLLRKGTYLVSITGQKTGLNTGTRYYCLDDYDDMNWLGFKGQCTIKVADGQSTDAAPKDVNILMATGAATKNHRFRNIIFDCNGQNNPISPDRANGNYNRFCSGAYNLTGDDASIDGLSFVQCEFWNCPGTNNVVTGQSANGVAGPLSQNVHLRRCKFRNNGLDVDDHTSFYAWSESVWAGKNVFEQDADLDKTGKNWVAWEIHGADQWWTKNKVKGYYRACWIASNFTRAANNLHVEDNRFEIWGAGPSLFRELANLTEVHDARISRNRILITDDALWAGDTKMGVSIVTAYPVYDIFAEHNTVIAAGATAYQTIACNLSCTTAGQTVSKIFWRFNHVERCVAGLYARVNNGTGFLTDIYDEDNTYLDLGDVNGTPFSFGSFFQADAGNSLGVISSQRNRYLGRSGTGNFDYGVYLSGVIATATVDANAYEGLNNSANGYGIDHSTAGIDRSIGRQLRTGTNAPTSGTWVAGEEFRNAAPSRTRNIDHWKYDGANWWAYGAGFGSTVERPALQDSDQGYSYFDSDLGKMILWGGANGWYGTA